MRYLYTAQEKAPNHPIVLYLDIEGHVNGNGEFDEEMIELQHNFILENLLQYFEEISMPIIDVKNPELQKNDIPKEFQFISNKREIEKLCENKINQGAYIIEKVKKEYGKENKIFVYSKKEN